MWDAADTARARRIVKDAIADFVKKLHTSDFVCPIAIELRDARHPPVATSLETRDASAPVPGEGAAYPLEIVARDAQGRVRRMRIGPCDQKF